jgi:hypothetical protein
MPRHYYRAVYKVLYIYFFSVLTDTQEHFSVRECASKNVVRSPCTLFCPQWSHVLVMICYSLK